ncbi:hypothetical protein BUALT_Bualt15G0041900 [Buddleja alternifolia]|uniref:RING-type E3 ubiquitin transferase n=1 Tax=Buddleja alternifolia TaxID=168488 RepID=A0AAV6WDX0_9LAMI|nr:hypothetical protein BUALT_Bualt15G0041900 [Buddleja alternifolia]
MQRKRSASTAFPEPIDLNQVSFTNNTGMDNSTSGDHTLDVVSSDEDVGNTNAANNDANNFGESSTNTNNLQDRAGIDDSEMGLGWSSSLNASSGPDARSVDWSFEPTNTNSTSYIGNQVTGTSLSMQNYSLNHGHVRETEQIPTFYTNVGTSSGSSGTVLENNDASDPSFGIWDSSYKRKALEGTSGQVYPGGSSSSSEPMGKNIMQDPVPNRYTTPRSLSISSGPLNLSRTNQSEQLDPSSGVGMNRAAPAFYPSSRVPVIAESSSRNFTIRSNLMHHESVPFDAPRSTSGRNLGVYASQQESRTISNTDSSELRSSLALPTNPANTLSQPHIMHVNEARSTHSYPWNGSIGSRGHSSSGSFVVSGERGSEVNFRSSRRNNLEYPMNISTPETRDVVEDQIDWNVAPGASSSSRNRFGWRASSAALLPQQNRTLQTRQRLSEDAPSIPSPSIESDSEIRRSHFALIAAASSTSDEVANTSGAQDQSDQRRAAFLIEMPGDDVIGRRSLADLEGRHRLIRQVLNAVRRGVHLRAEDYVLIDPLINGFAELHDRHRDMRLDVDNMSYEELLALGEQIGEVSTGLSEEKIKGSMKQHKYEASGGSPILEPCCICREDYMIGDDIGVLDCGHEFHTSCVEQWLILKNICPICKTTALETQK